MRRAIPSAVVGALVAAGAAHAQYYPYKILHDPQPFRIDGRFTATPAGPLSGVVSDVQAAANLWNTAAGSYARWSYVAPPTTSTPDPTNLVSEWPIFVTATSDPYYDLALGGGQVISSIIPLTYAGQLYACDIFLNAVDQAAWASGTIPIGANAASVQTVVLHEIGHCLGLEDAPYLGDQNNAMYEIDPFQLGFKRTALGDIDLQRISDRYPNNQSIVGSPCTTTCAPPLVCIQPPSGGRFCSSSCSGPTASCPIPYVCKLSGLAGGTHTCLPNTGTDITQVGRECATNPNCGGPAGVCTAETMQASGAPLWDQGYCTQNCAAGQPACPVGSQCVTGLPGTPTSRCVKTCRVGFADCRLNYACAALPGLNGGVCIPACANDVDCTGGLCRSCDGLCFSPNRPIGQIGDPCTADNQCGPVQFCAKGFPWAPTQGICTQGCSYSCAACPNGTNCIANPFAGGTLMCMRDCAEGTCQVGQQCLPIAGSRGCAPGCAASGTCPPSYTCEFGQCVPINRDGGTCELCYHGTPGGGGGGGGNDGGIGPPVEGGCGCASSGATSAVIALAILFLATRRARRAWPPR